MNKVAHVLEKIRSKLLALKYGTCLILPEHCCNHRSKRIEAVLFHHIYIAAGVETEQVCNLFAQRSHHVRV